MGKNLDEILLDIEGKLPYFIKEYSKRMSSTTTMKTKIAYLNDILTFLEYCSKQLFHKDVVDITITDLATISDINIYDYLSYLGKYEKTFKNKAGKAVTKTYSNTEAGKCRKLSAIKSLYKKLYERKEISSNPLQDVMQKNPAYIGIRDRLTNEEVKALEKSVMEGVNINTELQIKAYERNKERDTCIMLIFLYSAIRVSELVNLNINDIDINNSTMTIVRKGNKRDKIPFADVVADFLNMYIIKRKNMEGISSKALFISQFKQRITTKTVENIIKKFALRANISKNVTPHTLRRTCLTAFYNRTKDIQALQRLAAHSNINTTIKFYASTSDEEFKEDVYNFTY